MCAHFIIIGDFFPFQFMQKIPLNNIGAFFVKLEL